MNTKGKFYIWLNAASSENHYWSVPAQSWTPDPRKATLFETESAALKEQARASQAGQGEAHVRQATRELNPA